MSATAAVNGVNGGHQHLDLPTLLESLRSITGDSFTSEGDRRLVASALSNALDEVELPIEKYLKLIWSNTALYSSLKIASDLDLFKKWNDSEKQLQNHAQLAQLVEVEETWLSRILKHLAAMRVLREPEPDVYEQTSFSQFFANSRNRGGWEFLMTFLLPTFGNLPEYSRKNSYRSPAQSNELPFQYALNYHDGGFFDWCKSNEKGGAAFNSLMSAYAAHSQGMWFDVYPLDGELRELQANGAGVGGEKLFVDVGGGRGQDVERITTRFPSIDPKSLVLQDQAEVLKDAHVPEGVELMPHDFFKEQPLKGAKFYFLHSILHDWGHEQCQTILSQLRAAMKPGHSKIIVVEAVIGAKESHPRATALDLVMASVFGTAEKREEDWRAMIEGVEGLRVKKVWSGPGCVESALEVVCK